MDMNNGVGIAWGSGQGLSEEEKWENLGEL